MCEVFQHFPELAVALKRSVNHSGFVSQKMLQSPYFFFDVVYLHNGVEEQGDDSGWRVSEPAKGPRLIGFYLLLCMFSPDGGVPLNNVA